MEERLTIEVTRKPTPPGFVCGLCGQDREYWQVAWMRNGTWLCTHCRLEWVNSIRDFHHLSWREQNTVYVARQLLKTLQVEIKNGKRNTGPVRTVGPR